MDMSATSAEGEEEEVPPPRILVSQLCIFIHSYVFKFTRKLANAKVQLRATAVRAPVAKNLYGKSMQRTSCWKANSVGCNAVEHVADNTVYISFV